MSCFQKREDLVSFLNNELTLKEKKLFFSHINECTSCKKELEEIQHVWEKLKLIPEPSLESDLQTNFNLMLKKEMFLDKNKYYNSNIYKLFYNFSSIVYLIRTNSLKILYSVMLVSASYYLGYFMSQKKYLVSQSEINSLKLNKMNQLVVLNLIKSPLASERIKAVNFSNDIENIDKKVINSLFVVLNNDDNDNVRLAALDALLDKANDDYVRTNLIRSIQYQYSPIVQITIAEKMLLLQEKRAVKPLKEKLVDKRTEELVKNSLSKTIKALI